jgi:hypothetical protein
MTVRKNVVYGLTAFLLLVVAGATGCGYKTMPVPPAEIVPRAIVDLRYELDDQGVTLKWTCPEQSVNGDALENIDSFSLFRGVVPADQYCENCPIPFGEPILVEGGAVVAGNPKTVEYQATLLRPGHLYFFMVRSSSGWWAESDDSNIVSFMWDIPPAAPQDLNVQAGDGKVDLRWSSVTTHMDGTVIEEPVRYQVFRSAGGGAFSPIGGLREGGEYIDGQVINGRKYQYRIQAVTMYDNGQVGGGVSPMAAAVPVDQTPPPVPGGVQSIRTGPGVKVVWDRAEAVDLKGYRVYRRLPGQTEPVMIGEVDAPAAMFEDTAVPEADEWFYSVSTIDRARPANESRRSTEAAVRN